MAIKVLKRCAVSPSHGGGSAEHLLPLVYFDTIWLQWSPTETLYFYSSINCSKSCFLETIVVQLRKSLSQSLKHFLPLAGNIIFPLNDSSIMPVSRYVSGDSVSLTIALSGADFFHLTGNHSRCADQFHDLVPQMPPATYTSCDIKFPVFAVQATLFPNQGICIGFTHHHAICDVCSLVAFVHQWASLHKFGSDSDSDAHLVSLGQKVLPLYDRSLVQDSNRLNLIIWDQVRSIRPAVSLNISRPLHKSRATFVLTEPEIEKMKKFVLIKKPDMARVSSFVVVCAHIWSCLAKSAAASGEEVADDEPEYLNSPVECRGWLNPPLPDTYFGNCLVFFLADSTHGRLKGNDGFVAAAEAIAAAISRIVDNGRGVLDDLENETERDSELIGKRVVTIGGSLKIDHYGADYGWGRAIKYECIHTDLNGAVNICKGMDGGVEIGLSMPKVKMDYFAAMFNPKLFINSRL